MSLHPSRPFSTLLRIGILTTASLLSPWFPTLARASAQADNSRTWAPFYATPLPTVQTPQRIANAVAWPQLGRQTQVRHTVRLGEWESMPMRYHVFTGAQVRLESAFTAWEEWQETTDTTGRYLHTWQHRRNPQVRFGFTALPRASFLPDLDEDSWSRYRGTLARRPGTTLQVDDDSETNTQMLRVLGGRTRVMVMQYDAEEAGQPARALCQIFVDLGQGPLLTFSLEAPAAAIATLGPDFTQAVASFDHPMN